MGEFLRLMSEEEGEVQPETRYMPVAYHITSEGENIQVIGGEHDQLDITIRRGPAYDHLIISSEGFERLKEAVAAVQGFDSFPTDELVDVDVEEEDDDAA